MEIRWGIVGLGRLADQTIAPAMAASPNARLVACAGRTEERTREFAAKHGVNHAYASYEDLAKDPEVDAVFISTPNNLRLPVVAAAAAAGKQLLCEKPMATTVEEAERMLETCRKAGVLLRLGFQMRFEEVLRGAADIVAAGRLGEVREFSIQRFSPMTQSGLWRKKLEEAGAGALADTGVHLIDFTEWILGDRISRVYGLARPARSTGLPDETVSLLLESRGGCQTTVRMSREMPVGITDIQLYGTAGMLVSGPLRYVEKYQLTLKTPESTEQFEYPAVNPYVREIEAFAQEMEGKKTVLATAEEGLHITRVFDAAISSLETGASVPISD